MSSGSTDRALRYLLLAAAVSGGALNQACGRRSNAANGSSDSTVTSAAGPLPTGVRLDPAAKSVVVGNFPLAAIVTPDGRRVALLLDGYRPEGVQILDRETGDTLPTLVQPAAFIGLSFSPDGRALYASGGFQDAIYLYDWQDGRPRLRDSVVLARPHRKKTLGHRYPAGLAVSPDGRTLYVAENLADSLAVVDIVSRRVVGRLPTGRYPYGAIAAGDGSVFVSVWGGSVVNVFVPRRDGRLALAGAIRVSRHPSAMCLNHDGSRLFVTSATTDGVDVIDTHARTVLGRLEDSTPAHTGEGSAPNALALSVDGSRLFVAEADNNAVAVFQLSARTAGMRGTADGRAGGNDRLAGRIPVEWYPAALAVTPGDTLLVVSAKGRGAGPNGGTGYRIGSKDVNPLGYTLGQYSGTVMAIPTPDTATLAAYTQRVARANNWDSRSATAGTQYPPFQHVIYIIKENRTYDQVFGDLTQADGDTSLTFFPRAVSPNHHALAERFGIWDRFFVNAEVSADGHNWSTAAYASDYVEKTTPANYSDRGRSYDYDGTNRGRVPPDGDDVAAPSAGYLWDRAVQKGISLRNYGEFAVEGGRNAEDATSHGVVMASKPALAAHTNPHFPGFDVKITDQYRADVWMAELRDFVRQGSMPALEIMTLPNDHTSGTTPHWPTPRAYVADNDLALGRIIEALSHTPFWATTVVFVLEDDAQDGADHVDSHRSPMLVISPYSRGGVFHRFANTTDVLATIEEILGLEAMSPFDYFGRPMRSIWRPTPDLRPYVAIVPAVALDETNPATGPTAHASDGLDFTVADAIDEDRLNRALWLAVKGSARAYPGRRRANVFGLAGIQ